MDVQRISDELEITALLSRYARAVDTKDWTLYRSVFTDDAFIDYSSAGAVKGTRDEVAEWLGQGFAAIPWQSRSLREESVWFTNSPQDAQQSAAN